MPMEIEGQAAMARCSVRKKKHAKSMLEKGWKSKGKGSKNRPKPDDKGLKSKGKGNGSKKKAKLHDVDDEVKDEIMVADAAGSKDEEPAHPSATETVTIELDLIEDYLMNEVDGYMTCTLLCPILHLKSITGPFDPTLLAPFEKEANFAANILQQHRLTNGPIELQMKPITTNDHDLDHDDDELIDSRGWMNWWTQEQRRKSRFEEKEKLENEARWNKLEEEA